MKTRILIPILLALLAVTKANAALSIIYSGIQNLPIPVNLEGSYLQIHSGATATAEPADFNSAPWINPFFGGESIATSPLLRPVITGAAQIVNLPHGAPIDSGSNFATGASGSDSHLGAGAGQFRLNVPGYIGFTFRPTVGGPDHYGWLQIDIRTTGLGKIISWGYQSAPGVAITAGAPVPIPELGALALLGLAGAGLTLRRRRGRGRSKGD